MVRVVEVIANLSVDDIASAREFYTDYLGLGVEGINLSWVSRFTSAETGACLQVVTRDETAPQDAVVSIKVDDVEAAYAEARSRGYEIVHPLSREPWGVHRFFVRAPDGNV